MGNDVGINYGVDYERALERLHHAAGKIFRQYREAKHGNGSEEAIERLHQAYIEAQREAEALSSRDEAAIKAVLARPVLP
jgi:RIO-like serine/threonine protein kinase